MRKRSNGFILAGATAVAMGGIWALARSARQSEGSSQGDRTTYPPLDVPKAVGDGVWIVDSGPMNIMGLKLPIRMTIFQLGNGELLLHSPTPFSNKVAKSVEALGTVRHLVAPNTAHWTFLADWPRAYPDATTWAVPGLRNRAQVRASDVRIDAELSDTAPPEWADTLDQGVVSGGGGFSEVWFFHRQARTLVLVDLVENLEAGKLPPIARLVMQASAATRGTTARYLRLPVRLGGSEAKRAIQAILALAPERVIFAHGHPFDSNGSARLHKAFAWLI